MSCVGKTGLFLESFFLDNSSGGSGGPVTSSVTTLAVVCSGIQARSAGGGLVDVSGLFMEVE